MTALPLPSKKKLGLVIDLDTCVGCHAGATSCKEWNAGGIAGPLTDERPFAKDPQGVWFNRVLARWPGPRGTCTTNAGWRLASLSSW